MYTYANVTLFSKALNKGNKDFNVYTGDYSNNLLLSYQVYSTTITNWRFNTETIRIALTSTFTYEQARTVVYIRVKVSEGGINYDDTFHHVNGMTIQSGYVVYFCTMDLWGTYFKNATLTNIKLGRTNKIVGTLQAVLPPIPQTYTEEIEYVANNLQFMSGEQDCAIDDIFFDYLTVMFALKYNIYQTPSPNPTAVTEIGMFAIPLSRLIAQYVTDTHDTQKLVNIMELVQSVMGGIYAIDINNTELNAEVMGVWVVEDKAITSAYTDYKIKFRTAITGFDNSEIILDKVSPYQADDLRYVRSFKITLSPQYEYYFGTYSEGLKLPRFVKEVQVNLKYIVEADKLRVIASCGTEEKDITSAFGLTVTHVDGDVRNVAYILNAMQSGIKLAGAGATMVAGAFSGNELAGVMGGMGLISNISEMAKTSGRTGTVVDSGDAMTTYWISAVANNKKVHNPFILHKYESIRKESDVISKTGAIYDDYISSINLISNTPIISGDTETFVKLENVEIAGIPLNASDYIASKLKQGIFIINEQ